MRKKRQLKELDVTFISLVGRPANGQPLVLKATEGSHQAEFVIAKMDDELQRVYGVVYAPEAVDSQGDWADAQTIRRAADGFMRRGRQGNVDINHDFEPSDMFVAESWLLKAGDLMFGADMPGAWAVGIQLLNKDLWVDVKAGKYTGISLAGVAGSAENEAENEPPEPEDKSWFQAFLSKFAKKEEKKVMTPEELEKVVDAVAARLEKSLAPAAPAVVIPAVLAETAEKPPELTAEAVQKMLDTAIGGLEAKLSDKLKKGADESGGAAEIEWEVGFV